MIRKLFVTIILTCFVLQLSGCAGIQNDGDRTRAEGAAAGTAGGAAIGALIGQIVGGDTASTLIGASIGAISGLISGYFYGDHVANQKAKYAKEEDWLDACLVVAKESNSQIKSCNKLLKEKITFLKKEISNIKSVYSDKKKREEKMLVAKTDIDNQLYSAEEALTAAKAELDAQNSVVADARKNGQKDYAEDFDSEIKALKASIKELESRTDELASMSASMAV